MAKLLCFHLFSVFIVFLVFNSVMANGVTIDNLCKANLGPIAGDCKTECSSTIPGSGAEVVNNECICTYPCNQSVIG
ncbi:hypothetical protein SLEP1_g44086 [Rubroshorea leprosula]|uniref:Defensin-like protein n=1 Tax=Rubroshorea leprosula TaxID=152421 RepID=A0AAV5LFI2_9ROSI|nr:hypothetical protein SLEP1_g44086 [Rubroshorea leprosula]